MPAVLSGPADATMPPFDERVSTSAGSDISPTGKADVPEQSPAISTHAVRDTTMTVTSPGFVGTEKHEPGSPDLVISPAARRLSGLLAPRGGLLAMAWEEHMSPGASRHEHGEANRRESPSCEADLEA